MRAAATQGAALASRRFHSSESLGQLQAGWVARRWPARGRQGAPGGTGAGRAGGRHPVCKAAPKGLGAGLDTRQGPLQDPAGRRRMLAQTCCCSRLPRVVRRRLARVLTRRRRWRRVPWPHACPSPHAPGLCFRCGCSHPRGPRLQRDSQGQRGDGGAQVGGASWRRRRASDASACCWGLPLRACSPHLSPGHG